MEKNLLKKFLIGHPELSSFILSGCIDFNGDVFMRIISTYTKDNFKVSSYVDDDKLTDEEKLKKHEELAEKAIKVLYEQTRKEV